MAVKLQTEIAYITEILEKITHPAWVSDENNTRTFGNKLAQKLIETGFDKNILKFSQQKITISNKQFQYKTSKINDTLTLHELIVQDELTFRLRAATKLLAERLEQRKLISSA